MAGWRRDLAVARAVTVSALRCGVMRAAGRRRMRRPREQMPASPWLPGSMRRRRAGAGALHAARQASAVAGQAGLAVRTMLARAWYWLAVVAGILITGTLLLPSAGYPRQYAFVQALSLVIFAFAGPALLVLGARAQAGPLADRASGAETAAGPCRGPPGGVHCRHDQLAAARSGQRPGPRSLAGSRGDDHLAGRRRGYLA